MNHWKLFVIFMVAGFTAMFSVIAAVLGVVIIEVAMVSMTHYSIDYVLSFKAVEVLQYALMMLFGMALCKFNWDLFTRPFIHWIMGVKREKS